MLENWALTGLIFIGVAVLFYVVVDETKKSMWIFFAIMGFIIFLMLFFQ